MAAAVLAKERGVTVIATTRQADRAAALETLGVDHVVIDTGSVVAGVREIFPAGVNKALELVGTTTLHDTLRATAVHGVVCFTGMVSHQWSVADFYPIEYIPSGVRLTAYEGDAGDLPAALLQSYLDAVAAGRIKVPLARTYRLDEVAQAHADMEAGRAMGKRVVVTDDR
jgi:NADPH:quinone reductase-like Zn-dependent oxidoreductase